MAPSEVVAEQTIRKAMGISYEPTPSASASVETQNVPTSVTATGQPSVTKQQELDADINEFFAQGTASQPIVISQ